MSVIPKPTCPVTLPGPRICGEPPTGRGLCKRHDQMAWSRALLKRGQTGPAPADVVNRLNEIEAAPPSLPAVQEVTPQPPAENVVEEGAVPAPEPDDEAADVLLESVRVVAPEVGPIAPDRPIQVHITNIMPWDRLAPGPALDPSLFSKMAQIDDKTTITLELGTLSPPAVLDCVMRGAGMRVTVKAVDPVQAAEEVGWRLRAELRDLGHLEGTKAAERALARLLLRYPELCEVAIDVAIHEVGARRLSAGQVVEARRGGAVEVARLLLDDGPDERPDDGQKEPA